ncbi:MAG: TetR/AcrR family transcriptional regulator [Pseudomonadota bacterium]
MERVQNKGVQKRKKGLETTQQILDVSAELFARNGYDGVSTRQIAELVGIKESSLYNHFRSKADILESLFDGFIENIPKTRPSDDEIDKMLIIMEPKEVFKNILFHVGKSVRGTLSNTSMIISYEKFRNPRAADMYFKYLVNEPACYYERLINKMLVRKMIKPVDARTIAEQYNYVSLALTQEYIMTQYGLADENSVVAYMIRTLEFFCEQMKKE